MPTSCPAAPVLLSKLISKGYMLYESLQSQLGVAHLNYLLRQQSENEYLKSKKRSILHFFAAFLDFLIFRILDVFQVVWLSILSPWLDFLPGAVPKSIWAGISSLFRFSCSYSVHVLFSAMYFFDLKNGPWTMGVVQAAPQYPQVYGKIMGESFELSKFPNCRPAVNRQPGNRREDS